MAKATAIIDAEIEMEIERLRNSDFVHLAQKEIRLKQKRRNYMNSLRWLERRGKELVAMGIDSDTIEEMLGAVETAAEV